MDEWNEHFMMQVTILIIDAGTKTSSILVFIAADLYQEIVLMNIIMIY